VRITSLHIAYGDDDFFVQGAAGRLTASLKPIVSFVFALAVEERISSRRNANNDAASLRLSRPILKFAYIHVSRCQHAHNFLRLLWAILLLLLLNITLWLASVGDYLLYRQRFTLQ